MQIQRILACACFGFCVVKGADVSGGRIGERKVLGGEAMAANYAIRGPGSLSDLTLDEFLQTGRQPVEEDMGPAFSVDLSDFFLQEIQVFHRLDRRIAITNVQILNIREYGLIILSRMDFPEDESVALTLIVREREAMDAIMRQTADDGRIRANLGMLVNGEEGAGLVLEEYAAWFLPKFDLVRLRGILNVSIQSQAAADQAIIGEIEDGSVDIQNRANIGLDGYAILYLPKFNLTRITADEPLGFSGGINVGLDEDTRLALQVRMREENLFIGNAKFIMLIDAATRYTERINLTRHVLSGVARDRKHLLYWLRPVENNGNN